LRHAIVATVPPIISVSDLSKTYASGFQALKHVSLDIRRGEIFALLGPNGAGKTTLISIICGIVNPTSGRILVDGHDIITEYRAARSMIGLVPQELTTDAFESVWGTVSFSRGLFGKAPHPAHIERVLKSLSLWDKKDSKIITLSGGMKRRLLIANARSHRKMRGLNRPSEVQASAIAKEAYIYGFPPGGLRPRPILLFALIIKHKWVLASRH